ncbi:YHYH domain-containing protein [Moritella sp.]|nr:YHYH domain-containing protein [Moritella sp.]
MKKIIAFSLIFAFSATTSFAHSGGTDSYGCHAGTKPYHCHTPKKP